ncbi:MAG: glutathione S-transferase family protein [Actinobacteria bacterium]|nr:glutathione S-transferase family protein [Actinomycetota bacterium]
MPDARLITIPISHYCEKARWALDRARVDYREERHLQLFHHWYAKRVGGGFTTPVLVLPDGRAIGQSSEILRWTDAVSTSPGPLYPEPIASRVAATERWLDLTLGPDGRAWMYEQVLPHKEIAGAYGLDGVPPLERRAFDLMFKALGPYIRARVSASGASTDISRVYGVFDEVAARLDADGPYLCGDQFTAADLTFAALSAAVLLPRRYGVTLPPDDVLPPEMLVHVRRLREHPAGRFAQRVIGEHRPPPDG